MIKRIFDIVFASIGILFCGWLIFILFVVLSVHFRTNGFYRQIRIGQHGVPFLIWKLRTINPTTKKIPAFAAFLRKQKVDELPQFLNVLVGQMSIVGPRPDIPGYYDALLGENRKILELRPGLTGLASIKYRNEEDLLATQQHPLQYNDEIIFPDKVRLNMEYYYNQSFWLDLKIIYRTIIK